MIGLKKYFTNNEQMDNNLAMTDSEKYMAVKLQIDREKAEANKKEREERKNKQQSEQ